jgi:hypothetical protein
MSGYQLTKEARRKINRPDIRRKLMDLTGKTEFTIARYIQKNNGALTKYEVLELIANETGLTIEQMLEEKGKDKKLK